MQTTPDLPFPAEMGPPVLGGLGRRAPEDERARREGWVCPAVGSGSLEDVDSGGRAALHFVWPEHQTGSVEVQPPSEGATPCEAQGARLLRARFFWERLRAFAPC